MRPAAPALTESWHGRRIFVKTGPRPTHLIAFFHY